VVTTKYNGSYQNLLLFYYVKIDFKGWNVTFFEQQIPYMSAVTLNRDTFKVS